MPKAPPRQRPDDAILADHALPPSGMPSPVADASPAPRAFTAWHHFLNRALDATQEPGFTVESCVKLGQLPLEADAILLHLDPGATLHQFRRHFDFLVPILRPCAVVEYKSPDDRLQLRDFDTVRAYSMLCKRKYGLRFDHEVSIAMLYSHTDADFFADCATLGHPFEEIQPGIRRSQAQPMSIFAIDLVRIGELNPRHPINLLSARRTLYDGVASLEELGPFAVLYNELFLREIKAMSHHNTPGNQQLLDDAKRVVQTFVSCFGVDGFLQSFSPEDRLRGLPPEARLAGLPPEDRLRGLNDSDLAKLRELLLKSTEH